LTRMKITGISGRTAGYPLEGVILYCKLVLTAFFWGGTFVAGRIVSHEAGPFSAAFLRFLTASMVLSLFMIKSHGKFPSLKPVQILSLTLLGLTGVFAYNFFFFSGMKTITASRASLIIATNPAFIALLSSVFFVDEKLNRTKVAGIILSVAGAAVVVSRGNPAEIFKGHLGLGELYIFGCVLSWVAYSLIGKVAMKSLSPLVSVTYACIIGVALLLPPALIEGIMRDVAQFSGAVWVSLLYLGLFGSAIGFIWYYEGIKGIGPSRAGVFINIVPISSVLLAFLILRETLDASLAMGLVLVVAGVFLTNRSPDTRRT